MMRTFTRTVLLLSLVCAPLRAQLPSASSSAPSQSQGRTLTLAQAEALALKNNPQITIGKLRALVAHQYVREARSALLPTAYLSVTAVDANPGSRISAGGLNSPVLFPRAAAGATVGQLITDFGRSTNLLSSSQYEAKAEDLTSAATTDQITLAVDQAFYNALETKALLIVAQQTVDSRQLLVDKIQALTDAKLKSELDLRANCSYWKLRTTTRHRWPRFPRFWAIPTSRISNWLRRPQRSRRQLWTHCL